MDINIFKQAETAYKSGDYRQAAHLYREVAQKAIADSDNLLAAEMNNNSSVAFLQDGNPTTALETVLDTDKIFAQAGDRKRQARTKTKRKAI